MSNYKCPVCMKNIFEYKIKKDFKICQYCKTVFKTNIKEVITPISNFQHEIMHSNLYSDKVHYQNLKRHIDNKINWVKYDAIFSFYPGFPKLESILFSVNGENETDTSTSIFVLSDHSILSEKINDFRQIYDFKSDVSFLGVQYNDKNILKTIERRIKRNKRYLFSFVHVLEHIKFNAIEDFLKCCQYFNKNRNVDVVIYGPNIENVYDENWIHFRDTNHITFLTKDLLKKLLKLKLKFSINFNDDYLLYFVNDELLYLTQDTN